MSVIMPNFVAISQGGSRLPSLICFMCVWTSCEEHLVVVGQNLARIGAAVLIISKFYPHPENRTFWRFDSQN